MTALASILGRKYGGHDAEDLSQELAILAWQRRRRGDHPSHIRQGMKWYASRYYRDAIRRRKYWCDNLEAMREDQEPAGPMEPNYFEGARIHLTGLPSQYQRMVLLMICGYTSRQVCSILKLSKGSFHRLKKELAGGL